MRKPGPDQISHYGNGGDVYVCQGHLLLTLFLRRTTPLHLLVCLPHHTWGRGQDMGRDWCCQTHHGEFLAETFLAREEEQR